VLIEAIAQVRGLPAPYIPGLAIPQGAAGQLVAVAALLFVATPTVVASFPTPPAHASSGSPADASQTLAIMFPVAHNEAPAAAVAAMPQERDQPTIDYTVKRGDSLWKIADRLLGDGARYVEIVDLNQDVLNGRPDFITSGTVLKVPSESNEPDADDLADHYVVEPGDTLSTIAEARLGDPMRYPETFDASRDTVQPDGALLTDPDLIRPGWELTIPGPLPTNGHVPSHKAEPPVAVHPPADPPTENPTPTPEPTSGSTAEAGSHDTATSANDVNGADQEGGPGWLVPGLTGAGAVLAGAVLLTIRAHRRTQLPYRRPGQTITPPPPELRDVEKTAFVSGAPLTASMPRSWLCRCRRGIACWAGVSRLVRSA